MSFIAEVIAWYQKNKRDLPWRNTTDAYTIWLSEIILQQTRVNQGTPYFHRFAEKFPTVAQFAEAHEDDILKLWQGLGYYSRARNMHHTAQQVMQQHGGIFPTRYTDLIALKGIGEYTAAAISSFSSNEAKAVVYRIVSKTHLIHGWDVAQTLLSVVTLGYNCICGRVINHIKNPVTERYTLTLDN